MKLQGSVEDNGERNTEDSRAIIQDFCFVLGKALR